MIIASWNVNSVKMRLPILLDWLKRDKPDAVMLQEIKCQTPDFPYMEIEGAGYKALVKGQKAYNGVAILTPHNATLRRDTLPGDAEDAPARYIEAEINGFIVGGIYLPNGNPVASEKFSAKLEWMSRLNKHAGELLKLEKPVVLGGDYNVIPEEADAARPEAWRGDALFQPESRQAWRSLLNQGYSDAFRQLHPHEKGAYTYWDYQAGAFDRDDGIRIDHLALSPEASDRLQKCWIEKELRAREKASDHTPIVAQFA